MNKLIIFKALEENHLIKCFLAKDYDRLTNLLSLHLFDEPIKPPVFANYVLGEILCQKNIFAYTISKNLPVSLNLQKAVEKEIALIQQELTNYQEPAWLKDCGLAVAAEGQNSFGFYADLADSFANWDKETPNVVVDKLIAFHRQHGFGFLVKNRIWRWQGSLVGVTNPDNICLADLIGYEDQKQQILDNTKAFLEHNKGNNVLLYGQRGTGKSSLVKATANYFAKAGLSLIEIPRGYLTDLPQIIALLKDQPRHYLLFIDDLSFDQADKDYKELKGLLEGGVESIPKHILLYATSNRRHLVCETWDDRATTYSQGGELRLGDTMSEKLSLGDRFGLTITFSSPDQAEYLAIVLGIAQREGLDLSAEELKDAGLKWARWQNSPSGRTARQFINSLT